MIFFILYTYNFKPETLDDMEINIVRTIDELRQSLDRGSNKNVEFKIRHYDFKLYSSKIKSLFNLFRHRNTKGLLQFSGGLLYLFRNFMKVVYLTYE